MAVFLLPVPPHQLFPSGGFDLHTSMGRGFVGPFFCPCSGRSHTSRGSPRDLDSCVVSDPVRADRRRRSDELLHFGRCHFLAGDHLRIDARWRLCRAVRCPGRCRHRERHYRHSRNCPHVPSLGSIRPAAMLAANPGENMVSGRGKKGEKRGEETRSQIGPPAAAVAQPPPAHPGNSAFAGPSAPLVRRRRDARPQLRRSGRPAVREVSSEKRRHEKDRQQGRVRTPERNIPCKS